jgi:lambda family phage minor tail protein L
MIELFELDTTSLGGEVYYFSNNTNELGGDIVWRGQTYARMPIEASGFEFSSQGKLPRPTLRIANVDQFIGAITRTYDDLVGCKVTRRRTFAKFLDAVNFTAGNSTADPTAELPADIYYVERKVNENKLSIEWELAAAIDLSGVMLPGRQILANLCPWKFKGAECGYTGGQATCNKTLQRCEAIWGEGVVLPYGGFPAAGLRRS